MAKRIREAHETWKYLNQEENFHRFMRELLAYLQKNLQIIKVHDGKSSYQYYSCGQQHDPRNPLWKPFQYVQEFCRMKRCDFRVVMSLMEDRIKKRPQCECEILTDRDDLRRKELQRIYGMDFGEPGNRELDII
jgi:hypothetical protein